MEGLAVFAFVAEIDATTVELETELRIEITEVNCVEVREDVDPEIDKVSVT